MSRLFLLAALICGADLNGDGTSDLHDYAALQVQPPTGVQWVADRLGAGDSRVMYQIRNSEGEVMLTCEANVDPTSRVNISVDVNPSGGGAVMWFGSLGRVEMTKR